MTALDDAHRQDEEGNATHAVSNSAHAIELILAAKPDLYINVVGQPTIGLPTYFVDSGKASWPLRSERGKAWIAEFI